MTDDTEDAIDTSRFTDADWAAVNKLKEAHERDGQRGISAALKEIERDDLVTYVRIMGAFFPHRLREILKEVMAERGMTAEELRDLVRKSGGGSEKLH